MLILLAASLLFSIGHFVLSSTGLRGHLISRLGSEKAYMVLFSLLAFTALTSMIISYINTPLIMLWLPPIWLRYLVLSLMPFVLILFVGSLRSDSPTGMEVGKGAMPEEKLGVYAITRHPMLWAFAFWAALHILVNGDLASTLFFGGFLLLASLGPIAIDAKIRQQQPDFWLKLTQQTSNIPCVGLVTGRNSINRSILQPLFLGVALYVVLLFAHPWIAGVSIIP